MWRLVFSCLTVLLLSLRPGSADIAHDPFTPARLTQSEKTYLQAALTFSQDYNGLLDGAWGRGSMAALERWAAGQGIYGTLRFGNLRLLLAQFDAEARNSKWAALNLNSANLSLQMPFGLTITDKSSEHPTFQTADRSLLIRAFYEARPKTVDMHQWLHNNHRGAPSALYSNYRAERFITSARLESGKTAYLRSDKDGPGYMSFLIQYAPHQKGRGQLVAASIARGTQPDLTLPRGGILAAVLAPPAQSYAPPVTSTAPRPNTTRPTPTPTPPATQDTKGSGTGFYVNNTDIVTAAHVIDGCARLTLEDGAPLSVIRADTGLDLAVLSTARRSASWLPLSARVEPKLGENVLALGYPYRGLFDQGLSVTGGNISALPGAADPAKRVMLTAPVQPGNSGGPVLNKAGEVVGVVVSRANDLKVLEGTGTLPQNMNFAVSIEPLLGFLDKADVFFPTGRDKAKPLDDGIPPETQASVVSILCY